MDSEPEIQIRGTQANKFIGVNPKPRALKGLSDFLLTQKSPGPGRSADADLLVKPSSGS